MALRRFKRHMTAMMGANQMLAVLLVFELCWLSALADTPANCSYHDVEGGWTIYETDRGHDKTLDCSLQEGFKLRRHFQLDFPNLAVDEYGNEGSWTLIYNQGFEITLDGRTYFAFSNYEGNVSDCTTTKPGWSHNTYGGDWACITGMKDQNSPEENRAASSFRVVYKDNVAIASRHQGFDQKQRYKHNPDFIRKINEAQSSWVAKRYAEYENMTLGDILRRAGGKRSKVAGIPKPAPRNPRTAELAAVLPDHFDWRFKDGENYVSPVRNQGNCGSCYAFASMGMLEARQRIYSNGTVQQVYSPQDVVECAEYAQGCDGGFPYLIAGKYTQDFGAVLESCNPYKGADGQCSTSNTCSRQYGYNYRYVGGFYGACNEQEMKLELVQNGPIVVAFEVYDDFLHYSGGVYHHSFLEDHFNPFEITNHAVLLVGYGTDPVSGPYWSVKNSWGTSWGENGFFRIRRGWDECSIESIAVSVLPVV